MMAKTKTKKMAATATDRAPKTSTRPPATLTAERITRRAYDLYLARGCAHGLDVDDWLQAEAELKSGST
jgi:hypothetical protein